MIDMKIGRGISQKIIDEAIRILKLFEAGLIHARKGFNGKFISIEIGRRYRLVKLEGRLHWRLVTHETYNGLIQCR